MLAGRGEPRTGGADGDAEVAAALAAAGEETVTYLTDEVLLAILEERFTDAFLDTIERRRGGLFHCRMQGVALVIANSGRRLTFFTAVQAKAATPERVSRFNASHNFVRAYLDPEGDACLQLDVLVRTGITRASLGELAQLFALAVPRFVQEVGGETPPTADAGEATPLRAAPDEADPDADRPSDFGGIEIDLTPRTDGAR
ncbi:MAG: YbjN domain-containing protein [Planctomycetota bacterium]